MPRSGCSTSSVISNTVTGTTGEIAYRQRCSAACRATSTCAPHRVSATFTASDGCTENEPSANQALDPLRTSPDDQHRDQRQHPDHQHGRGQRAQPARRDAQPDVEHQQPGHAEHQLPGEHRVRRAVRGVGLDRGRREHHDQPEQREQPEHPDDQVQRGERAAQPQPERGDGPADRQPQPGAPARRARRRGGRTCGRPDVRWPACRGACPPGARAVTRSGVCPRPGCCPIRRDRPRRGRPRSRHVRRRRPPARSPTTLATAPPPVPPRRPPVPRVPAAVTAATSTPPPCTPPPSPSERHVRPTGLAESAVRSAEGGAGAVMGRGFRGAPGRRAR